MSSKEHMGYVDVVISCILTTLITSSVSSSIDRTGFLTNYRISSRRIDSFQFTTPRSIANSNERVSPPRNSRKLPWNAMRICKLTSFAIWDNMKQSNWAFWTRCQRMSAHQQDDMVEPIKVQGPSRRVSLFVDDGFQQKDF
jgi:hypothetical protein